MICHVCATEPACVTNICVIKKCLAAIEHQLVRMNGESSNESSYLQQLTVNLPPSQDKPSSVATEIFSGYSHSRSICIQDEVAEALEN